MAFEKITGAAIVGVMMIVIVMVVVIPVLDTASTDTQNNTPTAYATFDIPTGTYKAVNGGFTIDNGDVIELQDNQAILMSSTFYLIKIGTNLTLLNVTEESSNAVTSVSIDGTAKTYSATYNDNTYTGSIGDDAILRYTSGDLGVYKATSFTVDKDATIYTWFQSPSTGSSEYRAFRGLISGTPENLQVVSGYAYGGVNKEYVTSGTAVISDGLTSSNPVNCDIAANPTVTVTVTIDGAEKTYTSTAGIIDFAGPTTYTEVAGGNDTVKTLLDIVPLLMIVSVIVMIIGMFVLRS